MTKTQAQDLFGGTPGELADAMGVSPSAISQWPAALPTHLRDRVLGVAWRMGLLPRVTSKLAPQYKALLA